MDETAPGCLTVVIELATVRHLFERRNGVLPTRIFLSRQALDAYDAWCAERAGPMDCTFEGVRLCVDLGLHGIEMHAVRTELDVRLAEGARPDWVAQGLELERAGLRLHFALKHSGAPQVCSESWCLDWRRALMRPGYGPSPVETFFRERMRDGNCEMGVDFAKGVDESRLDAIWKLPAPHTFTAGKKRTPAMDALSRALRNHPGAPKALYVSETLLRAFAAETGFPREKGFILNTFEGIPVHLDRALRGAEIRVEP